MNLAYRYIRITFTNQQLMSMATESMPHGACVATKESTLREKIQNNVDVAVHVLLELANELGVGVLVDNGLVLDVLGVVHVPGRGNVRGARERESARE